MSTIQTLERTQTRHSESKKNRLSLIQPFIVLLIAVLMLELVFAGAKIGERDYLEPNLLTGVSLIPNKRITYRGENYSSRLINKYGMADKEPALKKPSNTFRIAVLGDSMIEGAQVEEWQTMCHFLEQNLNKKTGGQKVEVLNFGVPSFTLGQAYLLLKSKALSFEPDLVLIFVRDHASYGVTPPHLSSGFPLAARPYFFVATNGVLYKSNDYLMQWWRGQEAKRYRNLAWLRSHSRIWGALGAMVEQSMSWYIPTKTKFDQLSLSLSGFFNRSSAQPISSNQSVPSPLGPLSSGDRATDCVNHYFPVVAAILREMNRSCIQNNSKFAMIYISADDKAGQTEYELMKAFSQKSSAQLIDLSQSFKQARANSKVSLFLSDSHFTPAGHRVFADLIAGKLRQWPWFLQSSATPGSDR